LRLPGLLLVCSLPLLALSMMRDARSIVASLAICILFGAVYYSKPGTVFQYAPDDLRRLIWLVFLLPIVPLIINLTARRELRLKLHESAAEGSRRYRELVDDVQGVVWEADATTGRPTFVSRRVEEMLGFPSERFISDPGFWLERVHPDDRRAAMRRTLRALRRGEDHLADLRMIAAN
jgi:PAS domain-containing protein